MRWKIRSPNLVIETLKPMRNKKKNKKIRNENKNKNNTRGKLRHSIRNSILIISLHARTIGLALPLIMRPYRLVLGIYNG